MVLARRMGRLLLDAVVGAAQLSAGSDGKPAESEYPMNTTQVRYHRRRLADVAAAMRLARTQLSREQRAARPACSRHQQQRLETVVRHAATHSPFYRR